MWNITVILTTLMHESTHVTELKDVIPQKAVYF